MIGRQPERSQNGTAQARKPNGNNKAFITPKTYNRYDKHLYQSNSQKATYQKRSVVALSGFLSTYQTPEKPTRREYLGIYIYANPTEKFETEFNKTMLRNAELIKCRRTEAILNEEFGFLDRNRGKESFLEYFRSKMADDDNFRNWNVAYKHFEKYCGGSCTFDDLTLDYCQGFLTYMLSLITHNDNKMMASTANNNLNKLIIAACLRIFVCILSHTPESEEWSEAQSRR